MEIDLLNNINFIKILNSINLPKIIEADLLRRFAYLL